MPLRLVDSADEQDERILSAIAGEESAREWIVVHFTPPIYRYCRRMLRSEQDASELTQEVLLRALKALHRYDPERSFKTWIYKRFYS